MFKRNAIALLLAAALIALSACAGSSTAPQSSSAAPQSGSESQQPNESSTQSLLEGNRLISNNWDAGYLPQFADPEPGTPIVTLHTSIGDIKMMLFPQAAPKTVENFVTHCKDGYYDGVIFHRVIEDFMIQGGDPAGTGTGGESIWKMDFDDEFTDNLHNFRGALSMANSGYSTNGSQFFIVQQDAVQYPNSNYTITDDTVDDTMLYLLRNHLVFEGTMRMYEAQESGASDEELEKIIETLNTEISEILADGVTAELEARFGKAIEKYKEVGGTWPLDYKHTVFGQVIEGMDVVDAIARVETKTAASGDNTQPAQDVVIESVTVETA